MEQVKNYILTCDTLALLPYFNKYGECWTIVIEKYEKYLVKERPKDILAESCSYYGVSLKGIIDAAKKILPHQRMLPVCIPVLDLCFFPTKSMEHLDCQWIAHSAIRHVVSKGKHSTIVLINHEKVVVEKHMSIIYNKMKSASHINDTYKRRINEGKEYHSFILYEKPSCYDCKRKS
ncbi:MULTISPECIES: competence protein ComK [Aeribacillus]|uniref:competence protein ComK n=1 Tax=Aeribacillus TaxID=1055323 RepID=UPI000E362DF4|nr:competence protein ComK [Aeribacillus composti]REJ26526.1 MAG: hypothetical protein C6W54_01375 [Bacillaceae bacterium]TVZ85801.1 competence protein ComK [Aeribacillus composti]BBU38250.1 hypothetical protein APP_05420 [Aeribacillus pallidus]